MNTNILDNFLINQLQIKKDLNWDFFMTLPIHKEFSEYDNKLIDFIAFSFLSIEEKRKLFNFVRNSNISENIRIDLINYFENHFMDIKSKYPIELNLYKNFAFHFFNWILVVNDKIDINIIKNIIKKISSTNNLFWLCLIQELHSRKLFEENLFLISEKKFMFKSSSYHEDIVLFEIYSIVGSSNYLYSKKQIKNLCKLSSFLISYSTAKLFIKLECSLLAMDKSKFELVLQKNENLLIDFNILELLYIYEFSVLISSGSSISLINRYLYKHDIQSYENSNELYVYEFYNLLYKKEYYMALGYVSRLNNSNYDFKHIIWYLKQIPSAKAYLNAIESIINHKKFNHD